MGERHPHAEGCCDLKHSKKSEYVKSRILRDCGVEVEALVCSRRLGCSVLLLVVFRLRVKAVLKLDVLVVMEVEVEQLLELALAFHPPLVWSSG